MRVTKVGNVTFLRHWMKWYAVPDKIVAAGKIADINLDLLATPIQLKFEGLRPFWEANLGDDEKKIKVRVGKSARASSKS